MDFFRPTHPLNLENSRFFFNSSLIDMRTWIEKCIRFYYLREYILQIKDSPAVMVMGVYSAPKTLGNSQSKLHAFCVARLTH